MKSKDAVVKRINELCAQRDISLNGLSNLCGTTPSTIYSIMLTNRRDISISTIAKICDGLDISLREFFNTDYFDNIEQEIS
ncbi:helix-turn-helix domain-containing protein [uncultured Eubacterium sp.]|uniref:helix-turn-helix domain-containing protein n=1 Tax=uncultured Eubacterium sp. TaxID=165185 RepID=UPI0025F94B4E|nr:helix-turn-helix transcriptional regulator [uncultured Eubacterium sp.]